MILDESLCSLVEKEYRLLLKYHQKYVDRRETLLKPIRDHLKRLDNYSPEEILGIEENGFIIFKPNPDELDENGKYIGETERIFDNYSRTFYCFNGYNSEWFENSRNWLNTNETGIQIGIKKKIYDEIHELRYKKLRFSEWALFNAISKTLNEDFKAAFLFWGGAFLNQRTIQLKNNEEFELDETQRGHWDYIDNGFSFEPISKNEKLIERLKIESRIINPEFLGNAPYIPKFDNVEAYTKLLKHAKSTRIIPWTIPTLLSQEELLKKPDEIVFENYNWIHYDRDFTNDSSSANEIVFQMLKKEGIISCRNGWHNRYLEDERFKTLYYNEEGNYALFEKL